MIVLVFVIVEFIVFRPKLYQWMICTYKRRNMKRAEGVTKAIRIYIDFDDYKKNVYIIMLKLGET